MQAHASGRAARVRVGVLANAEMLTGPLARRRALLARVADAGLDHVFVADHVSFFVGAGMDGLVQAAIALAQEERLAVVVGVYLLALRHPVPVARQLATLSESAPGRLVLGVGVGGEDRHEVEICGVDPSTRGRHTDDALVALRGLLSGEPFSHRGEFFSFERAWIRPAPEPAIPIVVGGRSPAALRRAALHGDGWLAAFATPRRFAESVQAVAAAAREAGRDAAALSHGAQVWAGFDPDRGRARARLAKAMESFYRTTSFERFEPSCPSGDAAGVAAFLAPMAAAGCQFFNVMPVAETTEAGIDAVAEVKRRLLVS